MLSTSTASRSAGTTWGRNVGLLAVATVGIGIANYSMSLAALHLLPAASFANFAAAQGLLLVLGTGSFAALPWAVARYLARNPAPEAAARALYFGLTGSTVQAIVLAPIALAVCWTLDGPLLGVAGGLATTMVSLLSGPVGFLQGRQQLPAIAALRSIETLVRIAVTVLLIFVVSRQAAVVLFGFPIGTAAALAYAMHRCRSGLPMRRMPRSIALGLTRDAAMLGAIQVLLAMLAALDTVYVDGGRFSGTQIASYQAAALLARIPLFFSAAISTAAYTELSAAVDEHAVGRQLRPALRTYLWLCAPFLIAYLTMPQRVLDLVVPVKYSQTLPSLRILCVAGVLVGVINVLTTAHQARGRFRSCITVLAVAVLAQAILLVALGRSGNLIAFAAGGALVCAVTFGLLVRDGWLWLGAPSRRRPRSLWQLAVLAAGALAAALDHEPTTWLLLLVVIFGCSVSAAFRPTARTGAAESVPLSNFPTITPIEEPSR